MKIRYAFGIIADAPEDHGSVHIPEVIVLDSKAIDTGLYNEYGQSIYRLPNEIGFNR